MLAGINGGKVFSPFGKKRSNGKTHMGADYAVPGGSHILVPDVGTQLTVKSVGTDPRHSYGNHVRLEGNLNGHTIELLVAHMGNNSIKLQQGQKVNPGELIGLVGNTGNTSDRSKNGATTTWYEGKNSGYHMHLETKIDGKPVDPVNFISKIAPYMTKEQPRVPDSTTAMIPEGSGTTGNQGGNAIYENVMFSHPTEKPITIEMFNNFLRNAESGKYDNAHNRDDLIKYFQKKGYILNEKFIQNPASTNTSPDITAPIVTAPAPTESADVTTSNTNNRMGIGPMGFPAPYTTPDESREFYEAIEGEPTTANTATQPHPRSADVTPQPRANTPAQPQIQDNNPDDPIVLINPNTAGEPDIIRKSDIDEWERQMKGGNQYQTKAVWNNQGVYTRDDYIRHQLNNGYTLFNNTDANLANVLGTVGDSSHSPGPVHREETSDSIQRQINGLNGETSSDITPRNTGSPSWNSFMSPMGINYRFGRTPYPTTREYRIG